MSAVVDAVADLVESAWDAVTDFVKDVWDAVCMPILEEVFSWFGIEDETVVEVAHVSTKIFENADNVAVKNALGKVVMDMTLRDRKFLPAYMSHVFISKAQSRSFFRYGESLKYVNGLPSMVISGGNIDLVAIQAALDDYIGEACTILAVNSKIPTGDEYFKEYLQDSPWFYDNFNNTLTYTDLWGVSRSDWNLDSISFNPGPNNWTIGFSRTAVTAEFTIEGPSQVVEGEIAVFRIISNRTIPTGQSVLINLAYSGAAINGTHYTQVASVIMLQNTYSIDVNIPTLETGSGTASFTISIDSINNVGGVFEHVVIGTENSVSTFITDNDAVILTMSDQVATEANTNVTIPLTLQQDAPLYLDTTDTFDNGVDYVDADNELTLSITPDDDAYVYVEFDTVEATNWTRSGNVLTFTGDFTGITQIVVEISSRRFAVDWATADGTAVAANNDYTSSGATLNFIGNAGESFNLVIPILVDVVDDDREYFTVYLDNCTQVGVNAAAVATVTLIDYTGLTTPGTTVISDSFNLAGFIPTQTLIIRYYKNSETPDDWANWNYDVNSGTYPDIPPETSQIEGLDMMPVAILRKEKVMLATTDPDYPSTKRLLRKLDLKIDDIIANLAANPDIADVDDCYINFSLDPMDGATSSVAAEVIWKMFYEIIVVRNISSNIDQYTAKFSEGDVNNALAWTAHSYTASVAGALTTVGKYKVFNDSVTDPDGNYQRLRVIYQTNSSNHAEIKVERINSMVAIKNGGYHKMAVHTLGDEAFVFPMSWFIIEQLSPKDFLELLPKMVRLDITAIVVTHLEWYETAAFWDFFGFVLTVVAIVVSVLGAPTLGAAIINLVTAYAIGYVTIEIVTRILEANPDSEVAQVLAIAVAIYGASLSSNGAGLLDDVVMGIQATANVYSVYTDIQLDLMEEEWVDFSQSFEEQMEQLEELNNGIAIRQDMINYIQHTIITRVEKPETFFSRTLNVSPGDDSVNLNGQIDLEGFFEQPIDMVNTRDL